MACRRLTETPQIYAAELAAMRAPRPAMFVRHPDLVVHRGENCSIAPARWLGI